LIIACSDGRSSVGQITRGTEKDERIGVGVTMGASLPGSTRAGSILNIFVHNKVLSDPLSIIEIGRGTRSAVGSMCSHVLHGRQPIIRSEKFSESGKDADGRTSGATITNSATRQSGASGDLI
jgi:hypothetical protein